MPEASSILLNAEGRILPIAYPLDEFYIQASRRLPHIDAIPANELPQPARSLLVHERDMTPTLAKFYGGPIRLEVLSRYERGDFYFREVLLFSGEDEIPVEFGAIKIDLALLPPVARRAVLEEHLPFGQLLDEHKIKHSSKPKAYLRLFSDDFMNSVLCLAKPQILFGRRNTLFNDDQRSLAEIVEILPARPAVSAETQL